MGRRVLARVPASSANLGPGFDAFAAALGIHMELEVEETPGVFAVETDLPISRDRRNLVVRGFERLLDAEGFTFRIRSEIPLCGGLGTSAAAYVAGLLAADHLSGGDGDLLGAATELEGHPDNVAAALFGGIVICIDGATVALAPPAGLELILIAPDEPVRTRLARDALPAEVPLADAVFNVAHGAVLTLGLATGDLELVARGLADRIHQDRRAHLYPNSIELVRRAGELGALGATISGAGPAVLVWAREADTQRVIAELEPLVSGWAQLQRVAVEAEGAQVSEL
ncbi:unannotated protein [freshwater metagenome]|uniref:Unannotated protein n=1 Tax=freshwater metagenome TaxID=449393 RepID=A0A6J7DT00_9ZZZZ|nr:homoserine kinase [Actinomycetota bacterium]